jgi:hypothetical protein
VNETFGYPPHTWETAKNQARTAMIEAAREQQLITYGSLTRKIEAIHFRPHDFNLFHLLAQISTAEHMSGRGMLTAVVVTAEEGVPGEGFYELAKDLGLSVDEPLATWSAELQKVYNTWSQPRTRD